MKKYTLIIIILLLASFLRLYKLSSVPVSLFGDEQDVGYQAYSILKTGRDYYGNFMPLHFRSLAEWRTPLYLYSAVPTVALFGISPLGVRLPAAVFGILGVVVFYFLVKTIREDFLTNENSKIEILASFFLAISPWHIQYSRAGFEVTLMLFLLFLGLLFFFKSLKNGKFLWISSAAFAFTPWVYSTAKFFTPLFLVFLVLAFAKDIIRLPKKQIFFALAAMVVIGTPIAYSTLFGGGSQRFGYISVFSDPTVEYEVGFARDVDSWNNSIVSRIFHNKYVIWGESITNNLLQSYSTDFLFIRGDINLRHSIEGMGMFYKIEIVALLSGAVYFFGKKSGMKIKLLLLFWLMVGALPSAITRDGGSHATRLILILPPLIILIAFGVKILSKSRIILGLYTLLMLLLFINYQHLYWIHNPTYSERWWHYGWKEAIETVKSEESRFEKIVISTADEPPWIFFAGSYEYPPDLWQNNFPLLNKTTLEGFGEISYIDKYYFGSPSADLYEWGKVIDRNTLYLASTREVAPNLIREPGRVPDDLELIKAIAFPSGEPAFYLFTHK